MVFLGCILTYFVVIFVPTLFIYRYLESKILLLINTLLGKRQPLYEQVGIKKISAR